jgi:hypothetical protein
VIGKRSDKKVLTTTWLEEEAIEESFTAYKDRKEGAEKVLATKCSLWFLTNREAYTTIR